MTTFVSTTPAPNIDVEIKNDDVYPEITVDYLLSNYRIDTEINKNIVRTHLQTAVYDVNADLAVGDFKSTIQNQSLTDEQAFRYRDAVYYKAKAELQMTYRDTSATAVGHDRADGKEDIAGDSRRLSWSAIQKLLGNSTNRVRLI